MLFTRGDTGNFVNTDCIDNCLFLGSCAKAEEKCGLAYSSALVLSVEASRVTWDITEFPLHKQLILLHFLPKEMLHQT